MRWRDWFGSRGASGRRTEPPSRAVLSLGGGGSAGEGTWTFPEGAVPQRDVTPARWVEEALSRRPWATLGALVPDVFESYARVLHPAHTAVPAQERHAPNPRPVTWMEIADRFGTTLHPLAQFRRLAHLDDLNDDPEGYYRPDEGFIPDEVTGPLLEVLRGATSTPEHCWFLVWNGYGGFDELEDLGSYPLVSPPGRDYVLVVGSIDAFEVLNTYGPSMRPTYPSLWWPDDRAWVVATDIDLDSTYVGGSASCIERLLAHSELESFPARVDDPVGLDADTINLD